ncbi:GNAT family N-acetyltransferase [Yinghuangia aomiensis]
MHLPGAGDLAAMAEVFVHAWRSGYAGSCPTRSSTPWNRRVSPGTWPRDWTTRGWPRCWRSAPTGTPSVSPGSARTGEHADGAYLAALYVHPAVGGLGVGRTLLRHALDAMPDRDVRLWVFEANSRARDVYERAGLPPRRPAPHRPALANAPSPHAASRPAAGHARSPAARPRTAAGRRAVHRGGPASAAPAVRHRAADRPRAVGHRSVPAHVIRDTAIGTTVATPAITGDTEESILAALHGPITRALRRGPRTLAEAVDAIGAAAAGAPSARGRGGSGAAPRSPREHAGLGGSGDPAEAGWLPALLGNAAAPVRSDLTVSVDSPSAMAAAAREAVAEGFDTLKLKLADPEADVQRVAAVHAALGGGDRATVLRVDANQAWSPAEAVRVLDGIAALGIDLELVEQPVRADDIAGLAAVRRGSPWPVLADESVFTAEDVRRVADASAADLVNLKLLKCGGLGPARDVVAACAETGLGLVIGCMLEPAEGVAAAPATWPRPRRRGRWPTTWMWGGGRRCELCARPRLHRRGTCRHPARNPGTGSASRPVGGPRTGLPTTPPVVGRPRAVSGGYARPSR